MSLSQYSLHIDSEGYPLMDNGIRASDEAFLNKVFKNIKRYQSDDKQPLCTEIDSKTILLSSFDDPLVAQEVIFKDAVLLWFFLGGLSFESTLEDLRVDEWNRLHAYLGAEKLPAVMSHKAQSAFLLSLPTDVLSRLSPQAHRQASDALDSKRWDLPYQKNEMPWDMGKLNPVIEKHSAKMLKESGLRFLVPGAGSGHEIPFLEKNKKEVTAIDFSPTAKEKFLKNYPNSKANYIVDDFFSFRDKVDCVLELAFFVAIDPALRKKVVEKIHSLLSPKGFWGGSFITRYAPGGPPFGLSEWELREYTKNYFDIVEWQRSPHSHPRRNMMELWVLLRKKF